MKNNTRYISVQDDTGRTYLCPLTATQDVSDAHEAIRSDVCVEADVAGRYAGQIDIERKWEM